jgi:hypothetical protein
MTDNLPDYDAIEPPAGTPRTEYGTHERRAEVWRAIKATGSPTRVNKAALARQYDVSRKTIYRDFDRLREWASDSLGDDAKLTTRAVFETVVDELLEADDWRAKKAALDAVMDWNEWLADIGEQHREPDRIEADVRQRTSEVAYRVVRDEADIELPTDDQDGVDYAALGFTAAPGGEVDVEAVDDVDDREVTGDDE